MENIEKVIRKPHVLLTIKENDTVTQAAQKMSDNQVGCLTVFDAQNKFVGVVSERDILEKVTTKSLSPDSLSVRDIMTTDIISCSADTTVTAVERLMAEHRIRHVPIIKDGIPLGMVSSRDIIAHRMNNNEAMKNAAEQLAMLSTGLKSLDFEDVVALAINEVPKSFQADHAVLCFAEEDSLHSIIYRKGGSATKENLPGAGKFEKLLQNEEIVFGETCNETCDLCRTPVGQTSKLVIPISICDQSNVTFSGGTTRGFLCMCWLNPELAGPKELLLYKASLLRDFLNVNLTNAKLYQNYQEAQRDSETDHLTGLGTRRVLEKVLKAECARAVRYDYRFSIGIVDVDNFKQINDTAGHAAGDNVLKLLAKTMKQNVRMTDVIIARYGGDEFVLLMPGTKLSGAKVLLERLRRHVNTISLPKVKSFTITRSKSFTIPKIKSVTISCGLTAWEQGPPPDTTETLLKRADDALYEAKRSGRNQVVTFCSVAAQTTADGQEHTSAIDI